ncbi:MAG: OmpH family outer membrane protein [Bacteroidota bacterium]
MMKKIFFLTIIAVCSLTLNAQKFAYVDSKYILSHIPAYEAAQKEINELSAQWQMEIEAKYESILQLEKAYQAEKILLTEDMRKKREGDIELRKKEAMELQKSKFGLDGELFKKREELIAPIQEEIYKAIEEVASTSALMVVFDRSEHGNMLYTNPKHDISDKVIKKMGLKPGETLDGKSGGDKEDSDDSDAPKGGNDRTQPKTGGGKGK